MKIILLICTTIILIFITLIGFQSSQTVVITVPSDDYYKFMQSAAIEYNNSNRYKSDIKVEVDSLKNTVFEIVNDYEEQTDMFFAPSYFIPTLVVENVISPIDYDTTLYSDVTKDTTSYEHTTYMLPFEYSMPVFIYDPTYYSEAPKTINDLKPEDWATNFFSIINSELFIYQLWGNIYAGDSQSHTNTPEVVAFFTTIQSYYANDVGIWSELNNFENNNARIVEAYINDEIQAMIIPATKISELIKNQAVFEIGEMVTVDEYSIAHVYASTYGLFVSNNSENKKQCQDFIDFLSEPEMIEYFIEITANINPYIDQQTINYMDTYAKEIEEKYNENTHYRVNWFVVDMFSFSDTMYEILVLHEDVSQSLESYDQEHSANAEAAKWEKKVNDN